MEVMVAGNWGLTLMESSVIFSTCIPLLGGQDERARVFSWKREALERP